MCKYVYIYIWFSCSNIYTYIYIYMYIDAIGLWKKASSNFCAKPSNTWKSAVHCALVAWNSTSFLGYNWRIWSNQGQNKWQTRQSMHCTATICHFYDGQWSQWYTDTLFLVAKSKHFLRSRQTIWRKICFKTWWYCLHSWQFCPMNLHHAWLSS